MLGVDPTRMKISEDPFWELLHPGDRKRTEDALRRLSTRLIDAQDEERRRIARELHENTAQELAGMRMLLGVGKRQQRALPAATRKAIDEWLTISDKIIKEIRTLSYVLHPALLEEAGLCVAVPWYVAGFSKRSGIQIQVEVPNEIRPLPRHHETTLFRIMQECLLNIYRHSGSRQARIRILRRDHQVSMEVEDHGKGMTAQLVGASACKTPLGVGIIGMRERVRRLDGSFFIESPPGNGVTVRVVLPVKIGVRRGRDAQTSGSHQTLYPSLEHVADEETGAS
jgi:signal transduction histidine kinase